MSDAIKICNKHGVLSENQIAKENRRKGWVCKICKDASRKKDWGDSILRKCSRCQEVKDKVFFDKYEQSNSSPRCLSCNVQRTRDFREKNYQYHRMRERHYKKTHQDNERVTKAKNYRLKKYGIDHTLYLKILSSQNSVCAICQKEETYFTNKEKGIKKCLAVDHCHVTNKIRALLCSKCNRGIGFFDENIDLMELAIKYLKAHR